MRTYFRLAVLFPALLFVLPVLAQKRPAPPDQSGDPAKIKANIYQSIAKTGKLVCKITGLPDDAEAEEKVFEVQVEHEVKKVNAEGMKKFVDLRTQLNQAARAKNRGLYEKLYKETYAAMAGCYDVEKTPFTFKLVHGMASEEKKEKGDKEEKAEKSKSEKSEKSAAKGKSGATAFVVRREALPPKDPDNPKVKYTPAEQKELKGPGNYPGYAATLKDLENEMTVIVFVDKSKWKPPAPPKKKKKGDEEAAEDEAKPIPIMMIMIARPPAEPKGNPLLGN